MCISCYHSEYTSDVKLDSNSYKNTRCRQASLDCSVSATLSSCKYGPAEVSTPSGCIAVDGLLPHNNQQTIHSYQHPVYQHRDIYHLHKLLRQFLCDHRLVEYLLHEYFKPSVSQDVAISTASDVFHSH